MILNLGCGAHPFPGCVNVDKVGVPDAVAWNLDERWPIPDADIELIYLVQVFEHVGDPEHFMGEAHRVLKQGGALIITTPDYRHPNSFTDPTHVRHCTERTFDYWCAHTDLFEQFGKPVWGDEAPFEKVSVVTNEVDICAVLRKR